MEGKFEFFGDIWILNVGIEGDEEDDISLSNVLRLVIEEIL